jgi:hypothetical protein
VRLAGVALHAASLLFPCCVSRVPGVSLCEGSGVSLVLVLVVVLVLESSGVRGRGSGFRIELELELELELEQLGGSLALPGPR